MLVSGYDSIGHVPFIGVQLFFEMLFNFSYYTVKNIKLLYSFGWLTIYSLISILIINS